MTRNKCELHGKHVFINKVLILVLFYECLNNCPEWTRNCLKAGTILVSDRALSQHGVLDRLRF